MKSDQRLFSRRAPDIVQGMLTRIVSLALLLAASAISHAAEAAPRHILSLDLVGPVYAAATDVDAAFKGFINGDSNLLLNFQWIPDTTGAWSSKLGFDHHAFFHPDDNFYASEFSLYLGQEYRFFPFGQAPRGFFIGPMLQLQCGIEGPTSIAGWEGTWWYYAGLGASAGYQAVLGRIVFTLTTGCSVGVFYNRSVRLQVTTLGLPKSVELYLGIPF
jgi:hypothetical protein